MTRRLIFVVFALALMGAGLYAQQNLATVTGIVTDETGAVMPGIDVTVRNVDTGIERTMVTLGGGNYTINNLAPGNYEVTVSASGFMTYKQTMVLSIGQIMRVDPRLKIGQMTETVTVEAPLVTMESQNGMIKGDVMEMEEIQELPLINRSFMDLALLVPGVVPKAEGGLGSDLTVGGARASNTNFYVDGLDVRGTRGATPMVSPNIDAVQEFKMEVSGYSAEYGRMAGGIVNTALRTGTNEFHGNLNYIGRNDVFDARGYFDEERTDLHNHTYALTALGPIIKNKTFFLVSFDRATSLNQQTRLSRVPTLLERTGDFSESLHYAGTPLYLWDRMTKGACNANNKTACFPNNTIPVSRMDPIGLKVLDYYPEPNYGEVGAPTGYNLRVAENFDSTNNSILGKIDHKIGENFLAFRFQFNRSNSVNPYYGGQYNTTGRFGATTKTTNSLAGLSYVHVFSPTFLLDTRIGYVNLDATVAGSNYGGTNIAAELGLPSPISDADAKETPSLLDFPNFRVNTHADVGSAVALPSIIVNRDIQGGSTATWVKGSHTIKFGGNLSRTQFNQPYYNNLRGGYMMWGTRTGNPIADFELGWLHRSSLLVYPGPVEYRQTYMGAFFNDDWKATPRLTLNLGMRWEVNTAPYDAFDRMGVYSRELKKIVIADDRNALPNGAELVAKAGLTDKIVTARELGLPRSVVETDWINFAPRVGFAYRATDRMVLRGGYGIYYGGDMIYMLRTNLSNQLPFTQNVTYTGVSNNPTLVSLQTPFPDSRETLAATTAAGYEQQPKNAYVQSWNLTLEHEVGWGSAVVMDYRGAKGTHLWRQYDYNQPYRTLEAYLAGQGFARPDDDWGTINFIGTGSNSTYNAFNVALRKRSRSGMFFRIGYTWAKSIDDASQAVNAGYGGFNGALDSRNLFLDRGRSDSDRRHAFTSMFSYQMPFGRSRRWGSNWDGVTNGVLGGWMLSGTVTAYSGTPLTVMTNAASQDLGESLRPNRIADGKVEADSAPGRKGIDFPWYDLNAFEEVPCYVADPNDVPAGCTVSQHGYGPFAFGDSGRNILDGPGMFATNLALAKNFSIGEGRLQARLDVFNVFNRSNFVAIAAVKNFNSITGGILSQVAPSGARGGPRVFQYSLKYRF